MGLVIDPGQPVLYNAPTYNQLPYAVQRPQPPQAPREMVPLLDQAVAQVNAFVVGFNPVLPYVPQVAGLQTRARSLRLSLLQLRQEATTDANPRMLQTRLGEVNQLLRTLTTTWQQTVDASRLTSVPNLSEITLAVERLNQLFLSGYTMH
jgi:capsule polysaccharide export protein KpsE/RkpR